MRVIHYRGIVPAMAVALALALGSMRLARAESPSPSVPPSDPPSSATAMAVADSYSTTEDTLLNVAAPGLLDNDHPGPASCASLVDSQDLAGSVDVNADGSFRYTPTANFHGTTSFTYGLQVTGNSQCTGTADSQAVVTITVDSVDDPPVARPDSFIVLKNTTLNVGVPGVLINDSDIDSSAITAVKVTSPTHGVLILAADGSFSYTPAAGYEGLDGFSYKASDGQKFSANAVVTLTVTAIPPVATPTPFPTATPVPTDTPVPSVEEGLETFTPLPSDTSLPSAGPSLAPGATAQATAAASLRPDASPVPGASSDGGGLPLPVLLVLVLFVLLVAFGAALYVPKWLKAQSGEPVDRE